MARFWAAGRTLNGQEGVERPREREEVYAVFKVKRHRVARVVTAAKTAPNGKRDRNMGRWLVAGRVLSGQGGVEWSGNREARRAPIGWQDTEFS